MTTVQNNVSSERSVSFKFALAAAEMASNTRAEEVVLLDLRGRSPVTEFFLIATGTSPRQMRTVAEELQDLGKKMGFKAWQTSGFESGRWILVDCVTVVAHIFDVESRDFYDLELLWGDCPRIDWRKELGLPAVAEGSGRVRTRIQFGGSAMVDDEDQGAELVEVEVPDEDGEGMKMLETEAEGDGVRFPDRVEDGDETEEEGAMHVERTGARVEEALMDEEREVVGGGKGGRLKAKGKNVVKKKAVVKKKITAAKVVKKAGVKKPVPKKKAVVKKAAKKAVVKKKVVAKKKSVVVKKKR